jgi:epoxyqueuosine reductase
MTISTSEAPEDLIRAAALDIGFDACRFTDLDDAWPAAARLTEFIGAGRHGEMAWMADTAPRRAHPRAMWEDARSAIVLGMNYGPDADPLAALADTTRGAISVYAQGDDYHELIKSKLKALARWLQGRFGGELKVFVDTAPLLEKPLGERSGLGWQGKHTNLVSREFGSWLFLGSILTTLELSPDLPGGDHCGACRACLDICPTKAFPAPYQLDARRCISYLTIELRGPIPVELRPAIGNRIYGCDDCQLVCPWNKFARAASHPDFRIRRGLDSPRLTDLAAWTRADFERNFEGSAVRRIGYEAFIRNVAVALGNGAGDASAMQALRDRCSDPSALIAEHARWALDRLVAQGDRPAHQR